MNIKSWSLLIFINLQDRQKSYFFAKWACIVQRVGILSNWQNAVIFVCYTFSLYPRMNRNSSTKTSATCATTVVTATATRLNASNIMSRCNEPSANQPLADIVAVGSTQFSGKMLTGVATSHHYPLSCLVHLDDVNVSPSSARFRCAACHKTYSTVGGLSKHREFHCRALTAADPPSSRQTAGFVPVTGGRVVTTATKNQRCPQCDKAYTSASALKMHIRTHTLPCRCRLCGKAFSRPWLLQGHVRTHTGEKPFTCPHCQRAFADRSNLRAHLQTHYDVKQYHCDVCRRTFSRMSLLLKHRYSACSVVTDTGNTTTCIAHAQKTKNL